MSNGSYGSGDSFSISRKWILLKELFGFGRKGNFSIPESPISQQEYIIFTSSSGGGGAYAPYGREAEQVIDLKTKKSIFEFRRIITILAGIYSFNPYFLAVYLSFFDAYWFHDLELYSQIALIIALIASSTTLTAVMLRGVYSNAGGDGIPDGALSNFAPGVSSVSG